MKVNYVPRKLEYLFQKCSYCDTGIELKNLNLSVVDRKNSEWHVEIYSLNK